MNIQLKIRVLPNLSEANKRFLNVCLFGKMFSGQRYNIGETCPSIVSEHLGKPRILRIDEDVKKIVKTS